MFNTLKNIDQTLVGTQDAMPRVLPMCVEADLDAMNYNLFASQQDVNDNVRDGLASLFTLSFRHKEARIFPYLYPRGCFFDDNHETKRALRIRNQLFKISPRFRNCSDCWTINTRWL